MEAECPEFSQNNANLMNINLKSLELKELGGLTGLTARLPLPPNLQ
jgi:hypothetical protein